MKPDNPFTLTFGKQPSEYIARYEDTMTIVSTFTAHNPVSQTYLIEGIRGSGKTVLMTAISRQLAEDPDWVVVDLNATQDLLSDLAMRLQDTCKKMPNLLESGFSISVAGFGVGIQGSATYHNHVSLIEELLSRLRKRGKRVLITIDEVVHNQNMRVFASEFQLLLRKDYPLFLLMTGLYENIHLIQNDPALTFLLRAPKVRLGPLSLRSITRQYMQIFAIEEQEARSLGDITMGYAFAFQALGMLYYEHRNQLPMEKILHQLDDMLDDFVYHKIWAGLSQKERRIILEITDPKTRTGDICASLNMNASGFSQYRDRMIKKGLLIAPQRGFVSVVLPRFNSIVRMYGENDV